MANGGTESGSREVEGPVVDGNEEVLKKVEMADKAVREAQALAKDRQTLSRVEMLKRWENGDMTHSTQSHANALGHRKTQVDRFSAY